MTREDTEKALAETVDRLRDEGGSWWPGKEMAAIAYRRLATISRRNKTKQPSDEQRINDLAKGLQAHFEPDIPFTHPDDWRALAAELVTVFTHEQAKRR